MRQIIQSASKLKGAYGMLCTNGPSHRLPGYVVPPCTTASIVGTNVRVAGPTELRTLPLPADLDECCHQHQRRTGTTPPLRV